MPAANTATAAPPDRQPRPSVRRGHQRGQEQEHGELLGQHRHPEHDAGQQPSTLQGQGEAGQGQAETDHVLGVVQLHDGAAGGRQERQEDEEPGLAGDRVRPGRPQHRQGAHRQDQPRGHPEQALGPVPGRESGTGALRPALHDTRGHGVRPAPDPGPGVHPTRGRAPGRRADGRRERRHERSGQQRIARRVRERCRRGGGAQVTVGQGRGHRGQRHGVPTGRRTEPDGDDAGVAGGRGQEQHQRDHQVGTVGVHRGGACGSAGSVVRPLRRLPHRPPPRLGSIGSPYRCRRRPGGGPVPSFPSRRHRAHHRSPTRRRRASTRDHRRRPPGRDRRMTLVDEIDSAAAPLDQAARSASASPPGAATLATVVVGVLAGALYLQGAFYPVDAFGMAVLALGLIAAGVAWNRDHHGVSVAVAVGGAGRLVVRPRRLRAHPGRLLPVRGLDPRLPGRLPGHPGTRRCATGAGRPWPWSPWAGSSARPGSPASSDGGAAWPSTWAVPGGRRPR